MSGLLCVAALLHVDTSLHRNSNAQPMLLRAWSVTAENGLDRPCHC